VSKFPGVALAYQARSGQGEYDKGTGRLPTMQRLGTRSSWTCWRRQTEIRGGAAVGQADVR